MSRTPPVWPRDDDDVAAHDAAGHAHPFDDGYDDDYLPERRARRGAGGRRLGCAFLAVLLLIIGSGLGGVLWVRHQLDPVSASQGSPVPVVVQPGESVDAVLDELAADHLIRSRRIFGYYARFKGLSAVAAGHYQLDAGMSPSTILAVLSSSPQTVASTTVTFPEGLTAQQMGAVVEKAKIGITAAQYIAEVRTGKFNEPFLGHRPPGASLEGFLFPDTYRVPQGSTAHQVVQLQLDAFGAKAAPLLTQVPASQNDYQVVVVASLVEREARFDADRGLVAGVIDNRLAGGILLGVDASVTYGLGIAGEPTDAQLKQDTPYNTYIHPGLPPTPISNPGLAALTAAARPTPTKFVYYVSDGCGHNHYAVDAASHQRNIKMYVGTPCTQ